MDSIEQPTTQSFETETNPNDNAPHPFPLVRNDDTYFARKRRQRNFTMDIGTTVPLFAISLVTWNLLGTASSILNLSRNSELIRGYSPSDRTFTDRLGFAYTPIYYSEDGDRPEKGELANGLIVQMPRISQDNVLGESNAVHIERELNYYILKDIQDRLADSPHIEWVLLDARDFGRATMPQKLQNHDGGVAYDSVLGLQGYTLQVGYDENEDRKLIPFTTDEFLDLTLDTADLLDQFVEVIDDEELTALYEKALMADSSERKYVHSELIICVTRLLNSELRFKLDTDNYLAEPQSDKRLPRHTKLSQFITIRRTGSGFDVVRSAPRVGHNKRSSLNAELQDLRGGVRAGKVEIQLDDILRTSDTPVRDILAQESSYKRAQLLYLCDSLLRTADIDDLFTMRRPIEEVVRDMHQQAMIVVPSKLPKVFPTAKGLIKTFFRACIGMGIISGFSLVDEVINHQYEKLRDIPPRPVIEETSALPDELSSHTPIWHIETSDPSLAMNGYWVEQTFDTFRPENASWIRNAQSQEVDFPVEVPDAYIKLTRPLMYHQATTIPVKQGTRLAAIRGSKADGQGVDVVTRTYADGTVTAEYTGSSDLWTSTAIQLEIYLEPTNSPESIPLKIPIKEDKIDLSQADQSIRDLYAEARMQAQQGNFESIDEALAYLIQERHTYGIDPEFKTLTQSHSPEEFVKHAINLKSMHCNTANTMLALLSQDPERVYVVGYARAHTNKQNPTEGYLIASSGHGFTMNKEGVIEDATPRILENGVSHRAETDFNSINQKWSEVNKSILPDPIFNKNIRDTALKIGEIAGSVIGLSLLARLTLRLKREAAEARRKPEVQHALDNEFLSSFEPEHVTRAVDFLLHVSHHNENTTYHDREGLVPHEKPMDKLIKNCVIDRLCRYMADPEKHEPSTWMKSQRATARAIAGYVINVNEIFSSLKE